MSSYKNYLITSALLLSLTGCNNDLLTTATNQTIINNVHFIILLNYYYFKIMDKKDIENLLIITIKLVDKY